MPTEMIKKTGLVSVVIPSYNYGEYITDALEALKNQTYPDIELIIVDDGSVDNTSFIVNKWWAENQGVFKNFIYFQLPRNCSSSWALNIGFYLARGEYIVIHDADDYSHQDKIRVQVEWLQKHPESAAVGTNYNVVNIRKEFMFFPGWLNFDRKDIEVNYKEKAKHCVCFGTIMFRKDILFNVAGVKKIPEIRNDIIFIGEIINNGYIVDNLDDKLFTVRLHQKQKKGPEDFQKDSFNTYPERISIIVPVRYINSIRELLYRLAVQTYHELEIIVADDDQESNIKSIISEWKLIYSQLNPAGIIKELLYLQIPGEVGNPWLYNIASYLAKGKYIYMAGNNSLLNRKELMSKTSILNGDWPYSGIASNKQNEEIPLNWNNDFVYNTSNIKADFSNDCYNSIMLKKDVIERTGGLAGRFKLQI